VAGDAAVFAAKIEQRLSLVNFRIVDFCDKDRVVAGRMRGHGGAAQLEQRVFQDRKPARSSRVADGEAFFGFRTVHAAGKIFGDGLLPGFEHAYAEAFFLLQERKDFRAVVDANENQQGVERNRGEGVGGHALNFSGLALDGDDGHPSGKLAERFAKFQGAERGGCHL
jgi:hypothetical protein